MAKTDLDFAPLSPEEIRDIIESKKSNDFKSRALEQLLAELSES